MRALELDYLRGPRPRRWFGWVLLVLGALGVIAVNREATQTEARVEELVAKLAETRRVRGMAPTALAKSTTTLSAEVRAAHATLQRLSTPWPVLFDAIEAAQIPGVRLSGIEPEVAARSATLTGEARDYLSVLNYVNALESKGRLRRVHLIRHEIKAKETGYPLAFAVHASWDANPVPRTDAQPVGLRSAR